MTPQEKRAAERRRELVEMTIAALVEEAERREVARGTVLSNPEAWRAWKRRAVIDQAKREGAGWLKSQHERLGLGRPREPTRYCAECGRQLGMIWLEVPEDGATYCDDLCRSGEKPVTLREWLERHPEKAEAMRGVLPTLFDRSTGELRAE